MAALEIGPALAHALAVRLHGANVTVVEGDGADMPFRDGSFFSVACFTMLHHVPSPAAPAAQDRLLEEVHRVLRPGGVFVGTGFRAVSA